MELPNLKSFQTAFQLCLWNMNSACFSVQRSTILLPCLPLRHSENVCVCLCVCVCVCVCLCVCVFTPDLVAI